MKYSVLILLASALMPLVLPSQSFAECNGSSNLPSEQIHITFDRNGAGVNVSEAKRLNEWVAAMKSRYAIQDLVTIVGSASASEKKPQALATARAVAVAKKAMDDELVGAPIQIKTQIYPSPNTSDISAEDREVTVQLNPGCAGHCCASD